MRRLPILFLAALLSLPLRAAGADLRVELKNDDTRSVSVPLGSADGVRPESDFEVTTSDNGTLLLYPFEIQAHRFWSRTLSPEEFSRVAPGDPVRLITLPPERHAILRREGDERKAVWEEEREEARRAAARKEADSLRDRLERLQAQRDDLSDRIAEAEKSLAEEEGRRDWLSSSEDRDIDRALRNIEEYADRRDELQEQRNALAGRRPYPTAEANRLTAEITRLNDRIASERDTIRAARDRKRSARSAFLSRRQEWRKLVAERNRTTEEIRALERKIRALGEAR